MMILFLGIKLIKSQTIEKGRIYIRRLYLSALPGVFLSIIGRIFLKIEYYM